MRLLLPALLLVVGCQSAPATPDTPQPEQPAQPAAATASCCPTGTAEASAEACADGQCITLNLASGAISCRAAQPAPDEEGAIKEEPAQSACDALLGYAWDGAGCRSVSGCNTTLQLYPSAELCQQAHAHCTLAAP